MKITVNPYHSNTDVEDFSTNWVQDQDGIDRRQGCRAKAGTVVSYAINNLAGTHPRPLFWMTLPFFRNGHADWADHTNATADLFEFLWDKTHNQGRLATLKSIEMPRQFVNAPVNSDGVNTFLELQWAGVYGGSVDGTANTAKQPIGTTFSNYFTAMDMESVPVNIGNPTNLVEFGTFKSHAGYRFLDIAVTEDSLLELVPELNHSYADPTIAKPGKFVLADAAEQARSALHEIRKTNLPVVFTWSSLGGVANPDMVSPGSLRGMAVNSEADVGWVNLLDHAISSRNASTPGVAGYAYKSGVGLNGSVPVTCYVLGQRNSSAGDAQVRFETSWSNATVDLTYNGTGSLGWVGVTGLTMNSAIEDNSATNENKVDIYGSVTSGTAMTIFAMVGITQYPT
jgi:hypothetical protein